MKVFFLTIIVACTLSSFAQTETKTKSFKVEVYGLNVNCKATSEYAGYNHWKYKLTVLTSKNGRYLYQKDVFEGMVDALPEIQVTETVLTVTFKYFVSPYDDDFRSEEKKWLIDRNGLLTELNK